MTALLNPFMVVPAGDPYFTSTVLLLHLDGTNGSTTIIDSSPAGRSATVAGSSLSTAQAKFGSASWAASTTSSIRYADSADWHFSNGPFTVECFMRFSSAPSGVGAFVSQFGGSTNLGWFFGMNGSALSFFYSTTGTDSPVVSGTFTASTNTWYHFAADRDASNVLRVYADGAIIGSATVTATFFNSTRNCYVGNDEGSVRGYTGFIDEVRITKGVARYAGSFTPPTAAFPNS